MDRKVAQIAVIGIASTMGTALTALTASAQFRVGGSLQNDAAYNIGAQRGFAAGFNRGDAFSPFGGWYGWGESPIGGYMRGYADVISSVSQGMIDEQQSRLVNEQVNQARIDTRRKQFDEWLYERDKKPTVEDDRERQRIENMRRARNDPPPSEIWSGHALNELLTAIQRQHAQQVQGPVIPVAPTTIAHLNVTSGAGMGSVGLLRDGGKVTWPIVLQRPAFAAERKQLDELLVAAYEQARYGAVKGETIDAMLAAARKIDDTIDSQINELTPRDFSQANTFLRELNSTIRMLQDPNVSNFVTRKWAAKGDTVGEVVQNLTINGLRFAPANQGDQPAYNAMYQGLVAYLQWNPSHAWDTMTK